MLERIEEIQGIGLLHEANGKAHKWQKGTIVYGDNGRGKSTLSAILRSVSAGDANPIIERKTIDGLLSPKVTMQFSSGHKVAFAGNNWSESRPELLVFDSDFVEKNVHSGGIVNTGHRKNLLQFALGEKAVTARQTEEKATAYARKSTDDVQKVVAQLSGYHEGISLSEFEKLKNVADVDTQISELEKRIVAARSSELLLKRAVPSAIPVPVLELDPIFSVLGTTIEDIQDNAEAIVSAHVKELGKTNAESWLSQGQSFEQADVCPYCAQPMSGLALIKAYRTHFNAAYTALKAKIHSLDKTLSSTVTNSLVSDFTQRVGTASSTANAWNDQVAVPEILFDKDIALEKLGELRASLQGLVAEKNASPTAACGGTDDIEKIEALWKEIIDLMDAANASITAARSIIEDFRQKLATDDLQSLNSQHRTVVLSKKRYEPTVVQLLKDLATARAEVKAADVAKTNARTTLKNLMKQTLDSYLLAINGLLRKFGATFQIENMDTNFRGEAPRSEYGLSLRGKSISLEGGLPSFSTALSEGDKRTLAFVFFVASTLADSKLASRIVVVDDPMCSLDLNRKKHTRTVLKEICNKAEQLVVLAHDIYFVRDLRDEITPKDSSYSVKVLELSHSANGYTSFGAIDVDKECRSPYFHHHSLLVDYMDKGTGDHRQVAIAIRPLLEGYLHKRFPGLIPSELMFGQVVGFIKSAVAPSPVCYAQSLVEDLNEINNYAGQFHHDTNPGNADTVQIIPTELKTFVARTLEIIYKG
jgi:wobble nucleotide-excising tRNase